MLGHKLFEQSSQVVVVGLLLEHHVFAVHQVLCELFGSASGELLNRRLNFFLLNLVVLVVLVLASEALPRQCTLQEVQEDVTDTLHVISARLLDADVSVHGGVPCGARQTLVVSVGNVFTSLGVTVAL